MSFLFILSISIVVVESMTELLSKSMFFYGFRSYLEQRSSSIANFFFRAIQCPYCCSVWMSLLVTLLVFSTASPVLVGFLPVDAFIFGVSCHRVSNYLHDLSDRYFTKEYK